MPGAVAADRIAQLRRRWGIAPSQRLILHAARLTPLKGQAVVIEAARMLTRSGTVLVFATMLAVVLAGIGLGGIAAAALSRRNNLSYCWLRHVSAISAALVVVRRRDETRVTRVDCRACFL